MANEIIVKVRYNKSSKQKIITVPKDCVIQPGEYVELIRLDFGK